MRFARVTKWMMVQLAKIRDSGGAGWKLCLGWAHIQQLYINDSPPPPEYPQRYINYHPRMHGEKLNDILNKYICTSIYDEPEYDVTVGDAGRDF